jgi:hypothetical protein
MWVCVVSLLHHGVVVFASKFAGSHSFTTISIWRPLDCPFYSMTSTLCFILGRGLSILFVHVCGVHHSPSLFSVRCSFNVLEDAGDTTRKVVATPACAFCDSESGSGFMHLYTSNRFYSYRTAEI